MRTCKKCGKDFEGHRCKACRRLYMRKYMFIRRPSKKRKRQANQRKYHKRKVVLTTDSYIKHLIVRHSTLKVPDVPQWLVDLKRGELELKRALKEVST